MVNIYAIIVVSNELKFSIQNSLESDLGSKRTVQWLKRFGHKFKFPSVWVHILCHTCKSTI